MKNTLEHTDVMPYGEYKGWEMEKVPARYLLMLAHFGKAKRGVQEYINTNFNFLLNELKEKLWQKKD